MRSLAAAGVLFVSTPASADSASADRVLTHFAEDDRKTVSAIHGGFAATGGLLAVAGTVVLFGNDGDEFRRAVGVTLVGSGVAFATASLLGSLVAPRGDHEKLLARVRGGESLDTVERAWKARADFTRSARHWVSGIGFGVAALSFGIGTASVLGRAPEDRAALTIGAFSFGFVYCILATLTLAQTTTLESSWNGYRLATGGVSVLPNFAADARGARAGLSVTF